MTTLCKNIFMIKWRSGIRGFTKIYMEQKTYYIETYGCQMNVYDSELVSSMMQESGYLKTDDFKNADAIFLNTCSIREKAEETVHNRLDNFQHLKKKILV